MTTRAHRGKEPGAARLARLGAVAASLLGMVLVVLHRPVLRGNFGVVDPGRVYRCAQPVGNLERLLDRCRPDSILNVRGGSRADAWYAAEVRACQQRGIDFYDLPLSAVHRPTRRQLLILLNLLDQCRYPLLIHCKQGSDRTGLVCALYLLARLGEPPERALAAFSIAYGHFPYGGPEHLHEPFVEYAAWLRARGLGHSPERFRSWVEHEYRSPETAADLPTLGPGPRVRHHAYTSAR